MAPNSAQDRTPSQQLGRWQFGTRHLLAATTGVALVLGLAAWGGWLRSDAVIYSSLALLGGVFSVTLRRVLVGSCVLVGDFGIAMVFGGWLFGLVSCGVDLRFLWIFAGFSLLSAMLLPRYTKAGPFSLLASLLVAETFVALVIVYVYGGPTLLEAFDRSNRAMVLGRFHDIFPAFLHWWIVGPWLAGIVLREILVQSRRPGGRRVILIMASCILLLGAAFYVGVYRPRAIRCQVLEQWESQGIEAGTAATAFPNGLVSSTVGHLVEKVVPGDVIGFTFYRVDLTKIDLTQLRLFPDVTDVLFWDSSATDANLNDIVPLKKLQYLALDRTRITDCGLAAISGCRSLIELNLQGTAVTDPGMKHLAGLPSLCGLRLFDTAIGDDGLTYLSQCPALRSLILARTKVTDRGILQLSPQSPLSCLNLSGTAISDSALQHLASFSQLVELDVSLTNVGDAGVSCLARLPKLSTLQLRGTKITDQGLENWPVNYRLSGLDLGDTRIGDAAIQAVAREFPGLWSLDLDSTSVTAKGLSYLAHLDRLRFLSVRGTKIEPAALEDFRAQHSRVEITR